jgi:hypothetical protein
VPTPKNSLHSNTHASSNAYTHAARTRPATLSGSLSWSYYSSLFSSGASPSDHTEIRSDLNRVCTRENTIMNVATTPGGEMVANVILSTAQYERRLIGQRTREALAAKREQGIRLGRPQTLPDDVVQRIVAARHDGSSVREIAAQLETETERRKKTGRTKAKRPAPAQRTS